jgi:hypothetical protein
MKHFSFLIKFFLKERSRGSKAIIFLFLKILMKHMSSFHTLTYREIAKEIEGFNYSCNEDNS